MVDERKKVVVEISDQDWNRNYKPHTKTKTKTKTKSKTKLEHDSKAEKRRKGSAPITTISNRRIESLVLDRFFLFSKKIDQKNRRTKKK